MVSFKMSRIAFLCSFNVQATICMATKVTPQPARVEAPTGLCPTRAAAVAPLRGPYHGDWVEFAPLLAAAFVWFALHVLVAGSPLRKVLIARVGERTYRNGFSLLSLGSLWWLVREYGRAPFHPLWRTPEALYFVPLVLTPIALTLIAGAFVAPNPMALGSDKLLESKAAPRGVVRVTRHPFLWGTTLWATAHLVASADPAAWIFFGTLGATCIRGAHDVDRKRQVTHAEGYAELEACTSNLPFRAIWLGRNRLVMRELWLPALLGLALALAAIALHPRVTGASAIPWAHVR